MRAAAADALLFAGVALQVFACLGVVLMRTSLDRLHYTGVGATAALLIAAAVFVRDSFSLISNKAIVLAAFVLVTSPVLAHVTARAVHEADRQR
jgi:monovalent cation/proton antiporter MnhG/PhaG subunit